MYCIDKLNNKKENNMNIVNVFIYRHGDCDCTNNGLSSKKDFIPMIVLDKNETEAQAIEKVKANGQDPDNYLVLVRRELWGHNADYIKPLTETRWVMFGGNFAYASNAMFEELTGSRQPISIHDRVED